MFQYWKWIGTRIEPPAAGAMRIALRAWMSNHEQFTGGEHPFRQDRHFRSGLRDPPVVPPVAAQAQGVSPEGGEFLPPRRRIAVVERHREFVAARRPRHDQVSVQLYHPPTGRQRTGQEAGSRRVVGNLDDVPIAMPVAGAAEPCRIEHRDADHVAMAAGHGGFETELHPDPGGGGRRVYRMTEVALDVALGQGAAKVLLSWVRHSRRGRCRSGGPSGHPPGEWRSRWHSRRTPARTPAPVRSGACGGTTPRCGSWRS